MMRSFPDFELHSLDNTCGAGEANAERERRSMGWVDRKYAPKFRYVLQSQSKVALNKLGQHSLRQTALAFAWWTPHRRWLNLASQKSTP